jgi:hypothetical protein
MKPPRPLVFRSLFQSEIDSSKNILPSHFVGELHFLNLSFTPHFLPGRSPAHLGAGLSECGFKQSNYFITV